VTGQTALSLGSERATQQQQDAAMPGRALIGDFVWP
jgi:hypothetical protein